MANRTTTIAKTLARAMLAGTWEFESCLKRAKRVVTPNGRWLKPLVRRVFTRFAGQSPWQRDVASFILDDERFRFAVAEHTPHLNQVFFPPEFRPIGPATGWRLPRIESPLQLAEILGLSLRHLEWFADVKQLNFRIPRRKLHHYCYRALAKKFGTIRMIESPKPRLKEIQQQLLWQILDEIPPHSAAHGFRRGRSVRTFAKPHEGKQVVLRIDLQDFFPAIRATRINSLFRFAGYPEAVASRLTGLCTTRTPDYAWDELPELPGRTRDSVQRLYRWPHLPQGAPTSPALANLAAFRLDCRLYRLTKSAGGTYTRYADDLVFSGNGTFARRVDRFQTHVCAVAIEEGFSVNHNKTRIMRAGVQQKVGGVVVNEHVNFPRKEYDRLKATLTNCIRQGP
ncbi:MAG: reverse transcriptase family protein, partial [Planctomycetota bacterium]